VAAEAESSGLARLVADIIDPLHAGELRPDSSV